MSTVHVQFSGEDERNIVSAFSCEQDPIVWPYQGTVDSGDPRWYAFYHSVPKISHDGMPLPTDSQDL